MFARLTKGGNTNFVAEILMIVVGINIALWFEGYFEDLKDAETERQYLGGLLDDLRTDLSALEQVIDDNQRRVDNLQEVIPAIDRLGELSADQQAAIVYVPSTYLFFEPSDFTYQSMQESGDFRLLSDDTIKKNLLRLTREYRMIDTLQNNFIQAMDDGYIPLLMNHYDLVSGQIVDDGLFEDQVFRNFFPFTLQDTGLRLDTYKRARQLATDTVSAIEAQLGG